MLQVRGVVVQLVRIPACHAGGRGFESRPLRQNLAWANASVLVLTGEREFALLSRRATRTHMFDLVYKHKRIAQVILFADHGAVRLLRRRLLLSRASGRAGCRGDGRQATRSRRPEFDEALREQQDRMRQIAGHATSTRRCSTIPKCASRWSSSSVNQTAARERGARRALPRHRRAAARNSSPSLPAFQEDGKFSPDRYEHGAGRTEHDRRRCSSRSCATT